MRRGACHHYRLFLVVAKMLTVFIIIMAARVEA
jgi:hypothetical protein